MNVKYVEVFMNRACLNLAKFLYVCLFVIFSSINVKASEKFEAYFQNVINYRVSIWDNKEEVDFDKVENKSDLIPETLIKLSPSLSHFLDKWKKSSSSYIETLFDANLGGIAEKICEEIQKKEKLPEGENILLEIYKGKSPEINQKKFSEDFINLAYRVANDCKNIDMVKKLYPLTGVEKKEETLKKENPQTFSLEINYIHEPYWSYNLSQIQGYAHRIVEKIKPHFIDKKSIIKDEKGTFVLSNKEKIEVRKVSFGYVLPNLYLKKRFEDEKDKKRGVAKLFIIPKGKNAKFTFKMPYVSRPSQTMHLEFGDSGNNPLQVLTDDFDVYQERIEGNGEVFDKAFLDVGHRDLNAVQIITSQTDNRKYLIDTKEQKNFFIPFFSPFSDDYKGYPKLDIKDDNTFADWIKKNQKIVYKAKVLNFSPGVIFVNASVPIE